MLLLFVGLATVGSAKPDDAIPSPVLKGLEAYAAEGFAAAIDVWIKNSVLEGNAAAKGSMMQVTEVERYYGKFEGHQLVRVSTLTPRVKHIYLAMYYEKSPLWAYFDIYEKKNGEFIISEMLFNTKASVILPGDFFYR